MSGPAWKSPFGGMAPKLSAETLGERGMAFSALNCNLGGGMIEPGTTGATKKLYDNTFPATGNLDAEIAELELTPPTAAKPSKPSAPSAQTPPSPKVWKANPLLSLYEWLEIEAYIYQGYLTGTTFKYNSLAYANPTIVSLVRTQTGFQITAKLNYKIFTMVGGRHDEIIGPRYRFRFKNQTANNDGGPGDTLSYVNGYCSYPENPDASDPKKIPFTVPLKYDGRIYGALTLKDISGPVWDESTDFVENGYLYKGFHVDNPLQVIFDFDCNYIGADASTREWLFVQTLMDLDGRESIPSDILEVKVEPGEVLTVSMAGALPTIPVGGTETAHRHLYKSGMAGDKWLLQKDDISGTTWTDDGNIPLNVELPPYGNFGGSGETNVDTFRRGSVIYKDFGVAMVSVSSKAKICYSDYQRLHAWPEEWMESAFTGDRPTGGGLVLCSGGILAFEGTPGATPPTGNVWLLGGSNPAEMTRQRLSSAMPLLSSKGLARIGGRVYWVTTDGIASSAGEEPQLMSLDWYTPAQWQAIFTVGNPAYLEYHNSGLFVTSTNKKLKFEVTPSGLILSEYSAASGQNPVYKTGTQVLPVEKVIDFVKIIADADVTVVVGYDSSSSTIATNQAAGLISTGGLGPARRWWVQVTLISTTAGQGVREIELIERRVF